MFFMYLIMEHLSSNIILKNCELGLIIFSKAFIFINFLKMVAQK